MATGTPIAASSIAAGLHEDFAVARFAAARRRATMGVHPLLPMKSNVSNMQQSAPRETAIKLTAASKKFFYDVTTKLPWVESLDQSQWVMSPELVSLYGTPVWEGLDEEGQRRLAWFECAGFFSLILHGERPLLEGMSHRLYTLEKDLTVLEYMHHFLDEENKHMMMFSTYLRKYVGKIYPEKKIPFARKWADGEEDIAFFTKVLVVEELSDYFNVEMAKDERLAPIARAINHQHHVDEARHIHFGRTYLKDLWDRTTVKWTDEERQQYRTWLVDYINAAWRDFYNPSVYRDAGIANAYEAREMALASPVCREHRQKASQRFLQNLVKCQILTEMPVLQ